MNARRLQFSLPLVMLALGTLAGVARAQQPTSAQADAIRQSCRGDYQAHCASVPTGGSAALQCLKANTASLSPGCQAALGAVGSPAASPAATVPPGNAGAPASASHPMTRREQAAVLRNACGGDFRKYCQGVKLGGGRAIACLRDHGESLSPSCHDALTSAHGAR